MEINNIYSGQYKVSREMNPSFEAYWGKYGVDSENNIVKNVIESIFDILYQDTKKTLIDAEKNNPIFDRLEYSKLINILHNLLNKYLDFNTTDTKDIQKKLKTNIKKQIQEIIDNYVKNLKSVVKEQKNEKLKITPIKKELSTVFNSLLKVFFKQSQSNKKIIDDKKETNKTEQISEKNNDETNIEKFKYELTNQYKKTQIDDNSLVNDIKNTKTFKEYSLKIVKSVLRPSKTIQKISNSISKTTLKKIEKVNKLTKSTPGFGLFKKIIEIRYKKEHQKITNVLSGEISKQEKEQIKNAKTISKHIDGLKSMYLMNLGFVFSTFGKVLKPVGGLIDGAKNVIFHPLATLNKIFSNKWFGNILGQSLKNPATWYGLGFLTAKLWNKIEGPLYKYVLNPVTSFALKITDVFSDNSPLFGTNSIIGRALSTFSSIFQKNDGIVNPLFNMLLNIAKIINFEDISGLKTVFSNVGQYALTYLNAMVNIALSGKLAYFRGAGMIQKLLLLATHSNSSTLGSLFESDGNGNIILKNLKEYKEKRKQLVSVINNTFGDENSKLNKDGIEIQGKILKEYDDIQQDQLITLELQNIHDRLQQEDTDESISEVEISSFKQESKYTDINSLWKHFSSIYNVNTFEELGLKWGRKKQLEYLQFVINSRQRNAENEISNLFNSEKLKERYITEGIVLPVIRLKQDFNLSADDMKIKGKQAKPKYTVTESARLSPERVRYIPYGQTDNSPDDVWSLNGSEYHSRPNTKESEGVIQLIQPQYDGGKIQSLPNQSQSNPSGSIHSGDNKQYIKKTGSDNSAPNQSPSRSINIQSSGIVKKPVSVRIPKHTPDEVYDENQELQQVSQYIQEKIYGYNFTMMENNLSAKNDTIKILENALALDDIRRQTIKNQNNIIVNITNEKEIQDTDRGGII